MSTKAATCVTAGTNRKSPAVWVKLLSPANRPSPSVNARYTEYSTGTAPNRASSTT